MTSNYPYQSRAVRDLAWAVTSPALLDIAATATGVSGGPPVDGDWLSNWLHDLDNAPHILAEFLAARSTRRLGLNFETLWHFFLIHNPDTELLAHNVAVRSDGRTLGEFDCLYLCRKRQCNVHLELAVKLYLGVATEPPGRQWLGPNSRDRLDRKLDSLLQRQSLLAEKPEARQCLHSLGISDVQREIVLRGYLFGPFDAARKQALPLPVTQGCSAIDDRAETWLELDLLPTYAAAAGASSYRVLERHQWMSPIQRHDYNNALDLKSLDDKLTQLIASNRRPQLVAALDERGNESHRFFVTPPAWPLQDAQRSG